MGYIRVFVQRLVWLLVGLKNARAHFQDLGSGVGDLEKGFREGWTLKPTLTTGLFSIVSFEEVHLYHSSVNKLVQEFVGDLPNALPQRSEICDLGRS